jgi:hypothetical protein
MYPTEISLQFNKIHVPTQLMHFVHFETSLQIPSLQQPGSCIRNHPPTANFHFLIIRKSATYQKFFSGQKKIISCMLPLAQFYILPKYKMLDKCRYSMPRISLLQSSGCPVHSANHFITPLTNSTLDWLSSTFVTLEEQNSRSHYPEVIIQKSRDFCPLARYIYLLAFTEESTITKSYTKKLENCENFAC